MSVLEVTGLSAGYDGSLVVRDVDLRVEEAEVVVLLGANGAGKTTVLRAVAGTIRRTRGVVSLDGVPTQAASSKDIARRGVVHVPDDRGIFSGLTVEQHFRLGRRGQRLDLELACSRFPVLSAVRDRRAGLLSGGEQQMLALACALARRPRLLLIDEMSMGLAPVVVERILPILQQCAAELGTAVLMVEQDVGLALEVASRGYVLSHGRVVLHGDGPALRADRQRMVGTYLGDTAVRR